MKWIRIVTYIILIRILGVKEALGFGSLSLLWTIFMYVQSDQLNMAVLFWYLVNSDMSRVRYCTRVHWTSHFLHGSRKTRPMFNWSPSICGQRVPGSTCPARSSNEPSGLCSSRSTHSHLATKYIKCCTGYPGFFGIRLYGCGQISGSGRICVLDGYPVLAVYPVFSRISKNRISESVQISEIRRIFNNNAIIFRFRFNAN